MIITLICIEMLTDCVHVCVCVCLTDMRGMTSSSGQGTVKEFMPLIYFELRCIIEWAKKVPG